MSTQVTKEAKCRHC